MIALSLAIGFAAVANSSGFPALPECDPRSQAPCVIHHAWDLRDVEQRLGSSNWVWWLDHDRLTVVAKKKQYPWLLLCCDIQTPLEPIPTTELLGITVMVPSINKAVLQILPAPMPETPVIIRGPDAPAALERPTQLKGRLVAQLLYSKKMNEYRRVSIYTPPYLLKPQRLPVLYLADDLASDFASIAEQAVVRGGARPAMIVGISAAPVDIQCSSTDCDRRSKEYLTSTLEPGKNDNKVYEKHRAFLLDELIPYIERNYFASRWRADRCIGGTSNGGSWALTIAEASPERFGCVMAFSAGSGVAQSFAYRLKSVKVSGGYGTLDTKFSASTKQILNRARLNGAVVEEYQVVAGHSLIAWEYLFASAYPKLFTSHL